MWERYELVRLGQERGTGLVWTGLIGKFYHGSCLIQIIFLWSDCILFLKGYFTESMAAMSDPKKANSIYEFSAVDIDGNEVSPIVIRNDCHVCYSEIIENFCE